MKKGYQVIRLLGYQVILLSLFACSGGGGGSGGAPGPEPDPRTSVTVIASSDPVNNATDVDLVKTITLTFSILPPESAVTNANFSLTRVAGNVTVPGTLARNADSKTVAFTPLAALTPGMQYNFTIKKEVMAAESDTTIQFTARQTSWLFISRENPADPANELCYNYWTMNPDGTSKRQLTYYNSYHETGGDTLFCSSRVSGGNSILSPANRHLAYTEYFFSTSHEVITTRLFILNLETLDRRLAASFPLVGVSYMLRWSPDGGKLFFKLDDKIYSINSDGTGMTEILSDANSYISSFSADGSKLLITSSETIDADNAAKKLYSINSDGTGRQELVSYSYSISSYSSPYFSWARFSNDNSRIFYALSGASGTDSGFYTVDQDGSDNTKVSDIDNSWSNLHTTLSPDGMTIGYVNAGNIYVVNTSDTSSPRQITNLGAGGERVSRFTWSPDGTKILFSTFTPRVPSDVSAGSFSNLYIINSDGTGVRRLTNNNASNTVFYDNYFWNNDSIGVYYLFYNDYTDYGNPVLKLMDTNTLASSTVVEADSDYSFVSR